MAEKHSRRSIISKGAYVITWTALPSLGIEQSPTPSSPPPIASLEEAERPLAKPLSEEIHKLLKPALEANAGNARQRLAHKLPENSEPCFRYKAEPAQVR
jgi:hypothetical protein